MLTCGKKHGPPPATPLLGGRHNTTAVPAMEGTATDKCKELYLMFRRTTWVRRAAGAAGALITVAGLGLAAGTAHADTPLFTAVTHVTNDPDGGGGGTWATDGPGSDSFTRTLAVFAAPASVCSSAGLVIAPGGVCYTASISDSGPFVTILNAKQPNQSLTPTGDTISHAVDGTFTGTAGFTFWSTTPPSASNVTPALDATGGADTPHWYARSLSGGLHDGKLGNDWSWTYKTGCETWTDSAANGDGQSTPISGDGNITGEVCPAPAPSPTGTAPAPADRYGNFVNGFGNGPDVFRQHFTVNGLVAGWPATRHDPASHFIRHTLGDGNFVLEAAPHGVSSGLCVSNPLGGWAGDPAGPTGLVLRGCNSSRFQQFTLDSSGHLVSVVNGQVVNPAGKGGQLRTGTSPVPWGGSVYAWADFASLPA